MSWLEKPEEGTLFFRIKMIYKLLTYPNSSISVCESNKCAQAAITPLRKVTRVIRAEWVSFMAPAKRMEAIKSPPA